MENYIEEFHKVVSPISDTVNLEKIPWIPHTNHLLMKPIRYNIEEGKWMTLLNFNPEEDKLNGRFPDGEVIIFVLQGNLRIGEHSLPVEAGSIVIEKKGKPLTFSAVGRDDVIALLMIDGTFEVLDDAGQVNKVDNARSHYNYYQGFCEQHNLELIRLLY